jgi:hypothetical protein
MAKKKNSKKLDLSHLASLGKGVTPEPLEAPLKPPNPPTQENTPLPPLEEPVNSPAPAIVPPDPPQDKPASVPVEEAPTLPQEDAPTYRRQFDKKPQRKEIKPLKTLESVTNATGEVFQLGDKITVKAPWGGIAIAEITIIYQDESGNAWANYLPLESVPPDWSWLGGCTRTSLLVKA